MVWGGRCTRTRLVETSADVAILMSTKTTGQDISWLGLFPLSAEPDPNEDLHITCDDTGLDSSSCTTTPSPAGVTDTMCHEHAPSPKAIRRQLEPRQGPYGGSSGSSARIPGT